VYLPEGRRLHSSYSPEQCAALLAQIFDGYRPRKYPELPLLVPAGIRWHAAEGSPAIALSGRDQSDKFVLFVLAPAADGTEAGVFTLEGTLEVIGHWKSRDPSLASTGTWPARTVALTPPPISVQDELGPLAGGSAPPDDGAGVDVGDEGDAGNPMPPRSRRAVTTPASAVRVSRSPPAQPSAVVTVRSAIRPEGSMRPIP
jgi:hypothetical protein